MSDSNDDNITSGIQLWDRNQMTDNKLQLQPGQSSCEPDQYQLSSEVSLAVARKFLHDNEIKDAPIEAKEAFLRAKGFSSEDIKQLFISKPFTPVQETIPITQGSPGTTQVVTSKPEQRKTPTLSIDTEESIPQQADQPPVVTYPEFLAKPIRQPPLIKANNILNIICGVTSLSTVIHGTIKYLVIPAVKNLNEARRDLLYITSKNLVKLIKEIEKTVSDVPIANLPTKTTGAYFDDANSSGADDPSEMFHRDIGTQTSRLLTPCLGDHSLEITSREKNKSSSESQVNKLERLTSSGDLLKRIIVSDAESLADLNYNIHVFSDDLVQLANQSSKDHGIYSIYGSPRKNDPDDEIKKARDNIRRVKGVLLSTRNFPTSAR